MTRGRDTNRASAEDQRHGGYRTGQHGVSAEDAQLEVPAAPRKGASGSIANAPGGSGSFVVGVEGEKGESGCDTSD